MRERGIGIDLGLGLNPAPYEGLWPANSDLFDFDYAGGHFVFNGTRYGDEAAANIAAGLTKAGTQRVTSSSYIDPANTNLLLNGGFDADVANWTAFGSGGSIAWSAGALKLTSGGSLNGFRQGLVGLGSRAFRYRGKGRRTTSTNTAVLRGGGTNTGLGDGQSATTTFSTGALVQAERECGSASYAGTTYFGARNTNGAGSGDFEFDDFELVEAWPFLNFGQGDYSAVVSATAAAGATSDEVLWQADTNGEADRVRLVRTVADDHLRLFVTRNSVEIGGASGVDLGPVADGASFDVAIGISFDGAVSTLAGSLNGALPASAGPASAPPEPPVCALAAASLAIFGLAASNGSRCSDNHLTSQQLQFYSSPRATNRIGTLGDSGMAGAFVTALFSRIRTASGRVTINFASGGATFQAQVANALTPSVAAILAACKDIIWDDYSGNGYVSVATIKAEIDKLVTRFGAAKFIFLRQITVGPSVDGSVSQTTSDYLEIMAYAAFVGMRVFDEAPVLAALGTGTAQDLKDASAKAVLASLLYPGDAVHMDDAGVAAKCTGIVAML